MDPVELATNLSLKVPTSAFTIKTLLKGTMLNRHLDMLFIYLYVKLGTQRKYHNLLAVLRIYAKALAAGSFNKEKSRGRVL